MTFSFFKKYFTNYLLIQLIAVLVSLPFLTSWGLPLSCMSIVGNGIFIPFLTIFLLLSSLIFFTELFYIPNHYLIILLDQLSSWWHTLLLQGSKKWLISLPQPTTIVFMFISILIVTTLIIQKRFHNIHIRLAILFLSCFFSISFLLTSKTFDTHQKDAAITTEKIEIFQNNKEKIVIVDNGFFVRKQSVCNAITFDIVPHMRKNFGTTRCEKIVLNRPHARSFIAVIELCKVCTIERVELPYFERDLTKYDWFFFFSMKRVLKKAGVRFVRTPAFD